MKIGTLSQIYIVTVSWFSMCGNIINIIKLLVITKYLAFYNFDFFTFFSILSTHAADHHFGKHCY